MSKFIPLSVPNFSGREKEYATNAVVSEWVSTGGSLVSEFEEKLAQYCGMPRSVACNSGTSGLHLAMLVAGIGRGDEVIAPTLTFIAAVNPIRYANAQPVFIGCDDSLCMCPDSARKFCEEGCTFENGRLINKTTKAHVKALLIVHVFGNMADMPAFLKLCKDYNLILIEDATEALGTKYTCGELCGKMAGTIGDIGVYSFNGNKIITSGSGGALVSNNAGWAEHAKHLSTQAKADELHFIHDEIGYNYRLTNVQAALALAQLEQLEGFIAHKHLLYDTYFNALNDVKGFKMLGFRDGVRSNKWFFSLLVDNAGIDRDEAMKKLSEQRIQTRPIWALIHEQADYPRNQVFFADKAVQYRKSIINLPCSTNLSLEDADTVINAVLALK